MEEPLAPALDLVPEPGDVLQGDLRLGGHGAAALEGQALRRLEADFLPLKGPRRLFRRYGADVDGKVHRRSRRHQTLQEAWGQGPGPLAQVKGASEVCARPLPRQADAHLAASYLHLGGTLLVVLGWGAAEGGCYEKHAELPALQPVDGQPRSREQAAKIVDAGDLAHRVEAPVEDAVAVLKVGEQTPKGLGGGPRLRGKVGWLCLLEVLSQAFQTRQVLAHEELRREVQGVERPGEGPELRLVDLQAHHLAHAELHAVQSHRTVVVQVRQHEEQGQLGRRLGRGRRCAGF